MANEFLTAFGQGLGNVRDAIGIPFVQPTLQAQLLQQHLANQRAQALLPFVGPLAQQNLLSQQLANQGAQAVLPYKGQEAQAQLANMLAQAKRNTMLAQNPLLGQAGPAGQIGAYQYLLNQQNQASPNQLQQKLQSALSVDNGTTPITPIQDMPKLPQGNNAQERLQQYTQNEPANDNLAQMLLQNLNVDKNQKLARTDYYNKMAQSKNWASVPVDQKNQLLSQAAGFGISADEATNQFISGKTLSQMAQEKGFPNDQTQWPSPIYPTTKAAQTLIQKRAQSLNEINSLNPILTDAIKPYASRYSGYSVQQVLDAIRNDEPDKQAKYLAAQALIPEMAALRVRAMNGNVGIEAIREVTNASGMRIKTFQPLVTPEVWEKSQQYIDKWINNAVTSANRTGVRPYSPDMSMNTDQQNMNMLNQEDLEFTAKKYGMTVDQVKQRLGAR